MTDAETMIAEIDAYCERVGMSPQTLGARAGQGGHFYKRLLAGNRNWPETLQKVRDWMKANPPTTKRASAK